MIIIKKIEHWYYLFEIKDNAINTLGIVNFLYGFELDKEYDIDYETFFVGRSGMTLYHYDDKKNCTEEQVIEYRPKIMTPELKKAVEDECLELERKREEDEERQWKEKNQKEKLEREEIVKQIWNEKDLEKAQQLINEYGVKRYNNGIFSRMNERW